MMTIIAYVFESYRLGKTWLGKCLKSLDLEEPPARNMVNGPKTVKQIELGKGSLSDM